MICLIEKVGQIAVLGQSAKLSMPVWMTTKVRTKFGRHFGSSFTVSAYFEAVRYHLEGRSKEVGKGGCLIACFERRFEAHRPESP